ncbi:MAG: response regulator receiver sensor signal transduction histidine kinase [Sphingomonas bacterium]|nr:response regulator receiver sensor signal transduction histidine kinase [Sphingomonas bacterium]
MSDNPLPSLLLVEDSDTQALQFRQSIAPRGFVIQRTRTAEEALDQLNESLPDLLVVDYRLPGMNGDELVRILRQTGRTRTLPVLMLTGDAASEVERQGLDSGANAYVPKGIGAELLVSRMRALLRQRRTGPDQGGGEPGFRAAQLLLVEESATYRTLLRGLLGAEGHELRLATNEAEAFAALDQGAVDCVLAGTGSGADRMGLVRLLDARRTTSGDAYEIVALAADADAETVLGGLAAGADDVIARTSNREMLLVRIRATVRRKLARDDEARLAAHERGREVELAHARAQAEAAEALAAANRGLEEANAQLQRTQAQLVQSAKMASLGELVAGIAHEINNPLAFILAHQATVERAVRAAREGPGEEQEARLAKAADRLASIRTGLVRIQDLVVKLRRFSRLDDEAVQLDVPEAIDAVLTLLGPKIGTGVTVERRFDAPPTLICSPALINQVVMNLVANAADVVPPTGGRIVITTAATAESYAIRVADNGPGIPAELRERVFEPFFTTKDVGAGTGLGLAIAYGIVRAHGGAIEVGEGPEGGALFSISIPVRKA